jgi:hypothetical protein
VITQRPVRQGIKLTAANRLIKDRVHRRLALFSEPRSEPFELLFWQRFNCAFDLGHCAHGNKITENLPRVTPDEVKELLSQGKSPLIENFVSKRGNKFAAHLVLSAKKDKAEFEFLPR